jgi:hypothetical protein
MWSMYGVVGMIFARRLFDDGKRKHMYSLEGKIPVAEARADRALGQGIHSCIPLKRSANDGAFDICH